MGDVINLASYRALQYVKANVEVYFSILDIEVDRDLKWWQEAALQRLHGWRSREVYNWIQKYDWTARMYDGQPIVPIENVRWRR